MGINNLTDEVILVDLPFEGQLRSDELKAVNELVGRKNDCDILIDFFKVEIMHSWDISNLLILQNLLKEAGHKLVLFNMAKVTRFIFVTAGLSEAFTFAKNKKAAMEVIEKADSQADAQSQ